MVVAGLTSYLRPETTLLAATKEKQNPYLLQSLSANHGRPDQVDARPPVPYSPDIAREAVGQNKHPETYYSKQEA